VTDWRMHVRVRCVSARSRGERKECWEVGEDEKAKTSVCR